jgi:hypothetical protein
MQIIFLMVRLQSLVKNRNERIYNAQILTGLRRIK